MATPRRLLDDQNRDPRKPKFSQQQTQDQQSDRNLFKYLILKIEAIRWHTKLLALQETDGIESYHEQFELIRTRVTLPEDDLVRAYLAGLCPDTQMNVRMFQPHTVRQCLMIGKMYESVHPCQPRKSEKRSVPQDTEFHAPDVCSPINPQELMDSRSIGSTIISDISIAEDEECQENSQNRFVHGIPSNPSEFVFQGDLDKPEMGNTLVLLKLKGDQELLNTMMDDCKDKSIQFFLAHHAPQLFDEMSKRDFEDFRPSKVKCAIVSAGVGMNFMQLIAVLDGYNDLHTPHGKWLRIADAESIKTVAISSARQVFDNMPIRETQAVNKGSCLIVHALIVYVPVDGCIVISFNSNILNQSFRILLFYSKAQTQGSCWVILSKANQS